MFVGLVVGGLSVLLIWSVFLPNCSETCRTLWLGQKGIVEHLTTLATIAAAGTAGIIAYGSFKVSRGTNRSARFQKAIELINNESVAPAIGGLALLLDVAREDPETYWEAAIAVTGAHIGERGAAAMKNYNPFINPPVPLTTWSSIDRAHVTGQALGTIGKLRKLTESENDWPRGIDIIEDGRLMLANIVVDDISFFGDDFSNIEMLKCIFSNVTFSKCNFENSRIHMVPLVSVRFIDCNLTNCEFRVMHPFDGRQLSLALPESQLLIKGGKVNRTVVNERTLAEWIAGPRHASLSNPPKGTPLTDSWKN
ncbi:hypothetical protein XM25_19840 [Devosia sp. H5989]|nr:hypothetical protein XM25_19840 [Devosia sp. H5989]